MNICISETHPIARKEYECMASIWIREWGIREAVEYVKLFSEKRALAKAKANKYKIMKGQKYTRQCNAVDGQLETFVAIPEVHAICMKYQVYEY